MAIHTSFRYNPKNECRSRCHFGQLGSLCAICHLGGTLLSSWPESAKWFTSPLGIAPPINKQNLRFRRSLTLGCKHRLRGRLTSLYNS